MRSLISLRDLIIICSVSIIFSQVSWWVLFTTKRAQQLLSPEIVRSFETAQVITIASLPATLVLPIIAYFPFWAVTFTLLRIFMNLEKRRNRVII